LTHLINASSCWLLAELAALHHVAAQRHWRSGRRRPDAHVSMQNVAGSMCGRAGTAGIYPWHAVPTTSACVGIGMAALPRGHRQCCCHAPPTACDKHRLPDATAEAHAEVRAFARLQRKQLRVSGWVPQASRAWAAQPWPCLMPHMQGSALSQIELVQERLAVRDFPPQAGLPPPSHTHTRARVPQGGHCCGAGSTAGRPHDRDAAQAAGARVRTEQRRPRSGRAPEP
jgi:hypothetical protein